MFSVCGAVAVLDVLASPPKTGPRLLLSLVTWQCVAAARWEFGVCEASGSLFPSFFEKGPAVTVAFWWKTSS